MKLFRKTQKGVCLTLLSTIVLQIIVPTIVYANSTGDSQVEFSPSFTSSEMVNLYTGALNYSIPLLKIPGPNIGYSVDLNYNSDDVKMFNEASCVGFGWKLNLGSVSRNVKAVPDDFNGEKIQYKNHIKEYKSWDLGLGELNSSEYFGFPFNVGKIQKKFSSVKEKTIGGLLKDYLGSGAKEADFPALKSDISKLAKKYASDKLSSYASLGKISATVDFKGHVYWDNYSGFGLKTEVDADFSSDGNGGYGLGLHKIFDTKRGVTYDFSFSMQNKTRQYSFGALEGLTNSSVSNSLSIFNKSKGKVYASYIPALKQAMKTTTYSFSTELGIPALDIGGIGIKGSNGVSDLIPVPPVSEFPFIRGTLFKNHGFLASQEFKWIKSKVRHESFERNSFGYLHRENGDAESINDFIRYPLEYNEGFSFLPASELGTDDFVQSDQGSSGVFYARSNEFEYWSTPRIESESRSFHVGIEYGQSKVPRNYHIGVDVLAGNGTDASGAPEAIIRSSKVKNLFDAVFGKYAAIATKENFMVNHPLPQNGANPKSSLIKESQIHTEKNSALFSFYNDDAVRFKIGTKKDILSGKGLHSIIPELYNDDVNYDPATLNKKNPDHSRNAGDELKEHSYIQYLSTTDAKKIGRSKDFGYLKKVNLGTRRDNHIAEINVFENDGLVYTYSEPVYNEKRVDAFFSYDQRSGGDIELNETHRLIPSGNRKNGELTYGKAADIGTIGDLHNGMEVLDVTETPGYATSWPVAMITTSDYVDLGVGGVPDGPTNDDMGSWVKFTYKTTHSGNYKWRIPFEGAMISDGVKGEAGDNMGHYRYGEKEVKYVETIETKTHIAYFTYSNRQDGYPVLNEIDGGIDKSAVPLQQLNKIQLYLKRNELPISDPNYLNLVQEVNFDYGYTLVQGDPSNRLGGGKLTLLRVYSNHYNSSKGNKYKYVFDYGIPANNPNYNKDNVDRWGDFKLNKPKTNTFTYSNYPFQNFPYTEENLATVAPWCLREVSTPSGATMKFDYEYRDYSHVEDKVATQMYDIVSVEDLESTPTVDLDDAKNRNVSSKNYAEPRLINNNHVVIELDSKYALLTEQQRKQTFYDEYLANLEEEIYIKAYVELNSLFYEAHSKLKEHDYDFVDLTAMLADYRVKEVNGKYYGVIDLKKIQKELHKGTGYQNKTGLVGQTVPITPIRAAAFEHIKQKRQDVFFGRMDDNFGNHIAKALELYFGTTMFGYTSLFLMEGYANKIRLNGWSKVRLNLPSKNKIGGGYRIKSITVDDNWEGKGSSESYSYKKDYNYNMSDKEGAVSSGVALGPESGREEDANFKLYYYTEKFSFNVNFKPFVDNLDIHTRETDLHKVAGNPLDIHTIAPSVGYRKVTVSTDYPNANVNTIKNSLAPKTEYCFYSPKEFPTIKKVTDVKDPSKIKKVKFPGLDNPTLQEYVDWYKDNFKSKESNNVINYSSSIAGVYSLLFHDNALSQGHVVIKNDMAGKIYKTRSLTNTGAEFSSETFEYFEKEEDVLSKKMDNYYIFQMTDDLKKYRTLDNSKIPSLNSGIKDPSKKMFAEEIRLGEDYTIWLDVNENHQENFEVGYVQFGLGFCVTPTVPYPNPIPLNYIMPAFFLPINAIEKREKQAVLTKVISRKGLLKKVTTINNGSEIIEENVAFDQETGEAILSRVDNEWHLGALDAKNGSSSSIKEPRIYRFSRPAYWEYNENTNGVTGISPFLGVSQTIDKQIASISVASNGVLSVSPNSFADGDLVYYQPQNATSKKFGYIEKDPLTQQCKVYSEDYSSFETQNILSLRVVKSGNNNLIFTKVGELGYKQNVMHNNFAVGQGDFLNASAMTYKSNWEKYCCIGSNSTKLNNPFINGERNNWKPHKTFAFHGDRLYNDPSYSQRGIIDNFQHFNWQLGKGVSWVLMGEAYKYDFQGSLIESANSLNLYDASVFGFGNSVITASVTNSRKKECGVENFEELGYIDCGDRGNMGLSSTLSLNSNSSQYVVTPFYSHTGKYSLKVMPSNSFNVKKIIIQCKK